MRVLFLLPLVCLTSMLYTSNVLAAADCTPHPKEEWASEETLKEALEAEGYVIKKFQVDGNCYEIYGRSKAGKKVEIYFDTKTLAIVKAFGVKD